MRKRILAMTALTLLVGGATRAPPPPNGAETFAHGDFGAVNFQALNSVAVPWKLTTAALLLDDPQGGGVDRAHLRRRMESFGFLWPDRLRGAPASVTPKQDRPLGMSVGAVTPGLPPVKVTVGNLGCAACHSGPTYAADGAPLHRDAWLGAPNTSLDLESYTRAVTKALKTRLRDEDKLLEAVKTLYPETDGWEMASLRWAVIPLAKQRLNKLADGQSPLPFINGSPGLTNGVAALKLQGKTGLQAHEAGFTSVPDLADRGFRTALLYDGAYAPLNEVRWRAMTRADVTPAHRDRLAAIASFFTVPSMGQTPKAAHGHQSEAKAAMAWLETRRPQAFPGSIDAPLAARGADVFVKTCSRCHGEYDGPPERPRLASFPNWHGMVGTDPARAEAFTPALARYVAQSPYRDVMSAKPTGEYAAPLLSGVWASAPYLHNGSVPTLEQLMLLEPRAERFEAGGHRLDLHAVGVAGATAGDGVRRYPAGYKPWAQPAVYDTRQPGRSNKGHEAQFSDIPVADRWALIEYLKRL